PSYYETFKRSFVLNIVRRFFLTVDIPSPTLHSSIFDQIKPTTTSLYSSGVDSISIAEPRKPWYSAAVSRFIPSRYSSSQQTFNFSHPKLPMGYSLRRSHTAPVLSSDAMGLCSCVFKRRNLPPPANDRSQNQTLATTISSPPPCATCHPDLHLPQPRTISVKQRHSIYMSNDRMFSEYSSSDDDDESSARILQIENLVSLEDGHWTKVVEKCRRNRNQEGEEEQEEGGEQVGRRRVSRLYVYPLAYLLIWLPSIAYYIVSTHVYFTAFQADRLNSALRPRSLDMSHLPAHWTPGQNMNRVWPYYELLTDGVWGSRQLAWLT
ncbi:hypothetical protein GGI21_006511, partial [Coemansia aciculifera]